MNRSAKAVILRAVLFSIISVLVLGATALYAEVTMPSVWSSGLVIQRDMPVTVWGWAKPGESVTVTLAGNSSSVKADEEGAWQATLPSMDAGGPYAITIKGENTVKIDDILVGEVWLCSGQSNMQWNITSTQNAAVEVAAADYPEIRLFHIPRVTAGTPQNDVNAEWRHCTPDNTTASFSAVAYFFGRELYRELGVPIGLINSSWGGTRIEPWTPPEGFAAVPSLSDFITRIENANTAYEAAIAEMPDKYRSWEKEARKDLKKGDEVVSPPAWPNHELNRHTQPTGLYNAMIHPLVPFAIRGAIWYQGESNRMDGYIYRDKMEALIKGWRTVFHNPDLAFYYVQLAPYRYRSYGRILNRLTDLRPYALPIIWDAQRDALDIPGTGMAVTTDIATVDNIHPQNKQDVGHRLALWALAKTYGRTGFEYSGPLYRSMNVRGGTAVLTFDHVGDGLSTHDDTSPSWFQVAGADRRFYPAEAKINGDTIELSHDKVSQPVAVRYGWHEEAMPNLINDAGLPASPFRTDNWEYWTESYEE